MPAREYDAPQGFPIMKGFTYTFKTGCGDEATAEFDTYLELFDFNCNLISSDDNTCEDSRSKISWQASYDGYAHLNIHGSNPDAYGSYSLAYEISDPVSIPELSEEKKLSDLINIYPNPTSTAFQIETQQPVSFTKVVIYDLTDRMIRVFRMKSPATSFISGNLHLGQGIYILAVETNKGWVHKRLEIVK